MSTAEALPGGVSAAEYLEAVTEGVRQGVEWPTASELLEVVGRAIAKQGTPLPSGSHLRLHSDGEPAGGRRGADVVMVRTVYDYSGREVTEVLTERGDWLRLSEDVALCTTRSRRP